MSGVLLLCLGADVVVGDGVVDGIVDVGVVGGFAVFCYRWCRLMLLPLCLLLLLLPNTMASLWLWSKQSTALIYQDPQECILVLQQQQRQQLQPTTSKPQHACVLVYAFVPSGVASCQSPFGVLNTYSGVSCYTLRYPVPRALITRFGEFYVIT